MRRTTVTGYHVPIEDWMSILCSHTSIARRAWSMRLLCPDASNVTKPFGLLAYDTSTGPTEAAAYYQEQIPTLGWEIDGESAVTETDAFLNFKRGHQTLTVILSTESGKTSVTITLGGLQG